MRLPYAFDLNHDLKTKEEVIQAYHNAVETVRDLRRIVRNEINGVERNNGKTLTAEEIRSGSGAVMEELLLAFDEIDAVPEPMEQDGTFYLCYIEFANGAKGWDVVQWAEPNGMSSNTEEKKWVNTAGFALKLSKILKYERCDEILPVDTLVDVKSDPA